jgi:hypothetical protein
MEVHWVQGISMADAPHWGGIGNRHRTGSLWCCEPSADRLRGGPDAAGGARRDAARERPDLSDGPPKQGHPAPNPRPSRGETVLGGSRAVRNDPEHRERIMWQSRSAPCPRDEESRFGRAVPPTGSTHSPGRALARFRSLVGVGQLAAAVTTGGGEHPCQRRRRSARKARRTRARTRARSDPACPVPERCRGQRSAAPLGASPTCGQVTTEIQDPV